MDQKGYPRFSLQYQKIEGPFQRISHWLLRFFYPLWILLASQKKVDRINIESIRRAKVTNGEVTILLHGIFANYYSAMYWVIRWFLRHGINVISLGYDYRKDVATAAQEIRDQIEAIHREPGITRINLVGISLGGVVAHYFVENLGGKAYVKKLVTVFSPLSDIEQKGFNIAIFMHKLASWNEQTQTSQTSVEMKKVGNSFSVEHLAIYGTSDWVIGKGQYPLKNVPAWVTQRAVKGGHLLITYNTEAMEIALEYIMADKRKEGASSLGFTPLPEAA